MQFSTTKDHVDYEVEDGRVEKVVKTLAWVPIT